MKIRLTEMDPFDAAKIRTGSVWAYDKGEVICALCDFSSTQVFFMNLRGPCKISPGNSSPGNSMNGAFSVTEVVGTHTIKAILPSSCWPDPEKWYYIGHMSDYCLSDKQYKPRPISQAANEAIQRGSVWALAHDPGYVLAAIWGQRVLINMLQGTRKSDPFSASSSPEENIRIIDKQLNFIVGDNYRYVGHLSEFMDFSNFS